jgi:hypothetical protein
VLQFQMEGPPPAVPTQVLLQQEMREAIRIENLDPSTIFRRERKLGSGAGGVVYVCTDTRTGAKSAVKIAPLKGTCICIRVE